MRDLHLPGRSTVHSVNGMCATSQPLAAEAAISILRAGGNAVDAAIAASAVLCVVEPYNTGIGGDCFALLSKSGSGDIVGLNGSGRAPKALTLDKLKAVGGDLSLNSVHSVTVPGAVDAWVRLLADHGTMEPGRVFEPAIRLAEDGFAVAPRIALEWRFLEGHLAHDADASSQYTRSGKAPKAGDKFRLPVLAKTLRLIGEKGRDAFYEGVLAQDMVTKLNSLGGCHTLEDFAETACDYVTPIRTSYRGREICEIPPNGQGITALVMLNILSRVGLDGLDPHGAVRFHLEMEAARLAYDLRDRYVADPSFGDVPVEWLLSEKLADELAARIDPDRRIDDLSTLRDPLNRDTVYLTVVDRDRNAVSFINSLFFGFGSGILAPESGVMFQNRGSGFVMEEGHANCVMGGKRPLHTIIPAMVVEKGRVTMPFGVMGGAYQAVGHAHVISNMLDYDMDVQQALDSARAFPGAEALDLERGLSTEVREGLVARGHAIKDAVMPHGGGQAIFIDHERGTLVGGSDPRKDGAAVGY
ncbi:gamma-glutamyltransferase [Parvibaculum sp.]|jgi:gamma-glutamyltranspeptidase / glutathione hydrolase|uniref:gamma-glutamyltransferase n=1 Tax=Parvibaculum sp. TaxID=2024848 RepID=UPI001B08E6A8|nr:gamma-glutamyltransferase [Parvibaculum sp.]MBO6635590.1 gamma-glutamyltransferase [Parvibaculum sp.]MBO6677135.1 gamma-glutamyltransferase [Parvibaculum sp.]MBO6683905.1 gamma-glutamyltransferase [Parvibaculum sp.]